MTEFQLHAQQVRRQVECEIAASRRRRWICAGMIALVWAGTAASEYLT